MEPTLAKDNNFDEKLLELSSRMDEFEGYTHAHGLRIAAIADAVGKSFNLATHDRFFMQQAALVHDIGEVAMNREYIKQNRVLTDAERIDMQRHPVIGEQEAAKRGFRAACSSLFAGITNGGTAAVIPIALRANRSRSPPAFSVSPIRTLPCVTTGRAASQCRSPRQTRI